MGKGGSRRASRKKRPAGKVTKLPINPAAKQPGENIEIRFEQGVPLKPDESLGKKVTEKEHLTVKLLQARNMVIDKTKKIHELEILVAQKDNTIFMLENGLKDGSNLRESKESGEWYWIESKTGDHTVSPIPDTEEKSIDDELDDDSDDDDDSGDEGASDENEDGSDDEESAEVTEPEPNSEVAPTA